MTTFLATRLNKIKPSPTLAVTNKAAMLKAAGHNVIGLGAGEPDFDTPEHIKEAAYQAMKRGETKYTAVDGTPALKKAICSKLERENGLKYLPENIVAGCGAKHIIFNALFSTLNEGDEVIIPAPYWVSYPDMVMFADGKPVVVEGLEDNEFKITAEQLEAAITPKTKWIILNSPSNPTGSTYTKEELISLSKVLLKYEHVNILSDDIYEHVIYEDAKFYNIAQVEPALFSRTFTINGVSKAYSMTGWRIGYGAGAKELVKAIAMVQSQSTSNPCSIAQAAAVEALNGPQDFIKPNNEMFQRRRDFMVSALNEVSGVTCLKPTGAFYVFPSCKALIGKTTPKGIKINNDNDFATYLLEEALVAVVPGSAFGAEGYFRISYATSDAVLKEAMERIKKACDGLK